MRLVEVRTLIADAVMKERERCAKVAEAHQEHPEFTHGGRHDCAYAIVAEIRALPAADIRIIRPETAHEHPEDLGPYTIVAGQALIGDEIVDRKRMGAR